MIISAGKFEKNFIDDPDELVKLIDEYKKLDDAISNSLHYRMMGGKTQMIGKQENDYQENGRSRLEHTERIVIIAKKIINKIYDLILGENQEINNSKELKTIFDLNRELDIAEVVCMVKAHDIGHIAFSHTGEEAMNTFFNLICESEEIEEILKEHREVFGVDYELAQGHIISKANGEEFDAGFLSFEHNELSALLLYKIIKENNINLSDEQVRELIIGVLAHSTSRVKSFSLIKDSLPAQVLRIADKIEYINADYEELKDFIKIDRDILEEMYENDEIVDEEAIEKVLKFSQYSLGIRVDLVSAEIADEAIKKGRIWESRSKGSTLRKFRKCYEDAIFLFDSLHSYKLLKDELLPRLDNPEELQKFYEENPGVQIFYPEDKLRFINKRVEAFNNDKNTNEMDNPLWLYAIPCKSVILGENFARIFSIYSKVLEYYYQHPAEIPFRTEIYSTPINGNPDSETSHFRYELNANYTQKMQRLFEYISLFDDKAMMDKYYELVEERIKYGENYGIEPVNVNDIKIAILENHEKSVEKNKGSHTSQEAIIPYIIKGKKFFENRLTEKAKKTYEKNFGRIFSEISIDENNYRRMIEADRLRGTSSKTMEDFYYDDDYEIEKKKEREEMTRAFLREREDDDHDIDKSNPKQTSSGDMLPNVESIEMEGSGNRPYRNNISFTGKKKMILKVEDISNSIGVRGTIKKAEPKVDEVRGFKKLIGRLGLALEILGSRREDDAIEEYIKRKYGKSSKNNSDDPHGDGQK